VVFANDASGEDRLQIKSELNLNLVLMRARMKRKVIRVMMEIIRIA
jgi:hypothetical protein